MAHYTGGVNSICPFYEHEAKLSIVCEGMCPDHDLRIIFHSAGYKTDWQEKFCFERQYLQCPYAGLIEQKYI